MTSRNITTQANASALPFYHSRGVKRVHATTFVPEVGIFRGPTIKSFTRNVLSSSPAMVSSISLEDACNRPDPKCLQVNPLVSGHDRTTDHHTPSPTRVSLTPDLAPHGMTTGEISSSLDTASVGSPSVRSQSVTSNPSLRSQSVTSNPSLTDRDDYVIKEEFDDVSDDEANGLVIDDEADDNSHDANNDLVKNTAVEPKDSGGQVDKRNDAASDLQGEDPASVKSAAGESLPKRPCDDKKHAESLDVTVDTCTKLNNKVPSAEAGDTAPYIDKAIDYSLPKSLLFGCGSSKLSVNRKIDANLSSSLSACKQSSSVDKHHLGAQKKTSPPFRDFMSHSSSSVVVKNCRKLLKSSSSSSSGKLTSLACKPEKMVSQTPRHQACDKSTAKCQLIKDSPQHSPRCGSAPPIGASSSTLMSGGAAVCVSKGHVISIGDARCSKLSLDLQDRSEGSNEHSLGNNIPVGIAVAQIRPHHVQSTRDSQVSETHGRDVRLNSASVKAVPQCSQAESSETLPPSMVVTGRALNPASWLAQMPFTVHQSLNSSGTTFGPTHYPVTPPAGFKFTQDSITGQIYLVANGVETGVWPHSNFTSSSGTGHSHFQASNSLPSLNSSETKIGLAKEEVMPGVSDDTGVTDHILPHQPLTSADKNGATPDSVRQQVLTQQFKGGKVLPTPAFTSATTATALVNRVTGLNASAPFGDIKPSVQSRGCSPVQFEDSSSSLALLSTLSSLTSKRPSTCSIGIQTCSTLSQGSEKNISPAKIPLHDQGVQTLKSELSTLNPLSVQCPDLDSLETLIPKANTERSSYNPFTDPQILQAADGLELLSALAEKRPKCSSLDDHKRIFPSPSDSFKSDTASILALDDTLSPGDADLKSGQCTPRRDVRRDLSPKWSLPKKEQQTLAFGDFKAPTEMCSDSFEVRVKMAEVQRQYKEKQKKLAKLQIKKTEESHQNKRGPGRPPKKKPGSKKSDDDSSSSSSKTKEHSQHQQKKKRPAEELVDRVFRKLPPVKPCKVSRSIHYVKSKTGPFFKRKSASSSVKRNKDLFGFDESNWPSFSERKHQEKIKGSGVLSVGGNIFESFNKDYSEKRGRPAKTNSLKDTKLSTVSLLTVKTEPSQESGLGLLAKFALTSPTTQLTSPTSSLTLSATPCSSSPHVTVMSQLSTNTFSSSSGIYGGMYSSIYHVTNPSSTPTITFGSRSSLMSSANSGLMSFSSPGLSVSVKPATAIASSAQTCSVTSSLSQTSSGSLTTTVTWTASVSPSSANHSSSTEESSGTPCGSEASPHKRKQDEDSDTDTSESSPNKKRKPGRPKKINPDMSTGGTETIWAKKSSNLGLLQVTESNMGIKENDIKKLDVNIMKPLFLDEEWTRRRSERIFLSETSPQPSPAISPSPRGEPVWKLSNFMPKSKKILDVNKSVKDTDSKELIGSSQKSSSSCSSMPASNVLKTEDSLIPTLSAFSWSTLPNLPEPSPVKPEAEDTKDDETVWPQLNTTQKSKKNSEKQKVSSKDKDKKTCTEKTNKIVKCKLDVEEDQLPPVLIKKEKRAEEHSKIKLQKAKSLHDLTQRVKKKFSLANKKQDDQVKLKKGKKKRNSSTDSSDNDNLPLSAFRDGPPTPEPCSCKLQTTDLREGLKVLYLNDGLFYEGVVKALQPPDVYGVLTAGQRGSRPHILCQEEVLKDAVLDVRPGSIRYLPEGTRVCAFWSQQFSCLYPGTVAKSSPSAHATINVSVDFDDGDSGRIPIEHIRLLPADFPVVEYEPDPLENLPKRRRQTTSDSSDTRKPSETSKSNRNEKKQKEKEVNEDKSDSDESSVIVSSHKLWRWAGECTKRPGMKGKAKKIFYKSVSRGKEVITVGDSAVFVSTGRANCPFIGHIESLWQSWNGQMMVKVQWYYHPEETHSDKKLADPKNALFESHHEDENDVQTISHKCQVLNYADFKKKLSNASKKGKKLGPNVFYVAGFYDPSLKQLKFHSGVS
ncbi:hypothetical protein Btru_036014 [Bulinus truncatus]|nr:hypothetical protein Btru_036014 [Bulinus truncatus]